MSCVSEVKVMRDYRNHLYLKLKYARKIKHVYRTHTHTHDSIMWLSLYHCSIILNISGDGVSLMYLMWFWWLCGFSRCLILALMTLRCHAAWIKLAVGFVPSSRPIFPDVERFIFSSCCLNDIKETPAPVPLVSLLQNQLISSGICWLWSNMFNLIWVTFNLTLFSSQWQTPKFTPRVFMYSRMWVFYSSVYKSLKCSIK